MFCDGCGAIVQPGQAFCSKCGKQIVGPILATRASIGRVKRHAHLLGVLWLAFSAFNLFGGLLLVIVATALIPHLYQMGVPHDVPVGFLSVFLATLGILVLAKAVCGFLAGRGVVQHEPWARTVALVLAFISLINFPFGTGLGVYTLWVLLPEESRREYDAIVEAQAA
jgi:hypothetical protein